MAQAQRTVKAVGQKARINYPELIKFVPMTTISLSY